MPALDVEDFYESDFSDNDEDHARLLSSVSQLDSTQRVKPAQRKEIASEVSEYNLSRGVTTGKDLIDVHELAKALGKKAEHGVITKKFKTVTKKSKTLPKPLEKPTEERLKRTLGFEKVKNQLRRWDAIVARNAVSDRICFPLSDNSMKMQKSTEFLSQFKTKTPLEEEIAKVLKEDNKKTAEEEEKAENEFPLTLEEMLEKRKEMAQLRAKLSYRQTKAQRQSKIKSKKYHRLLKREKIKQQLKEFEILQKTDPEAALKKLSELDKTRAQERASLRHRNTGKWARNLTVRAKYDVETRKVLAEQLKVSRDLTQKVSQEDSSNDEGEEEALEKEFPVQPPLTAPSSENPWTLDVSKDVQEFVSGYKKFWSEKNKDATEKKSPQANGDDDGGSGKVSVPNKKIPKNSGENQSGDPGAKAAPETEEPKLSPTGREENEGGDAKPSPKAEEARVTPKIRVESEKGGSGAKATQKANISPKRMKTSVSIYPTSGVWIVTPVAEAPEPRKRKPKQGEDIDSLFDELNEKLLKKAEKKAERIKRELSKGKGKKEKEEKEEKEKAAEFDLAVKDAGAVQRPDMDEGLLEGGVENDLGAGGGPSVNAQSGDGPGKAPPAIDPEKFIQVKPKRLRTCLPEGGSGDEEALDDEKAQEVMMEEAFGDDDVVAEFNKMRREEEEKKKVEVQTSLPGWGNWAGSGIVPKVKKKRLLVLNAPHKKQKPKKDLIVNENENPNLRNHLVKEVPHPFTSVEAFEANIRAPIGRDWVPETAHQKLIQKSVVTKLGTVIEPMSENEIVRLKKASRCPYQGKKPKDNK